MNNALILEVDSLGTPVHHPNPNAQTGYEWRWSSDPEVSIDAPVHVFNSQKELQRFIQLAVQRQFLDAEKMKIIPITQSGKTNSITRQDAIAVGANPDNWNTIRLVIAVSGKSSRGPMIDALQWCGPRDDYNDGLHMQEGYLHAKAREWTDPHIYTPKEASRVRVAASVIAQHEQQMRPELRAAQEMARALETAVMNLDLSTVNPERAMAYLSQLKDAFIARAEVEQDPLVAAALAQAPEQAAEQEPSSPATSSSPRFH